MLEAEILGYLLLYSVCFMEVDEKFLILLKLFSNFYYMWES